MFPEFADSSEFDAADLWKSSLFSFDTNVLLNLYRYQEKARKEFLAVLTLLSDRIWIPYQVALEFQRNRLTVIVEQRKRFSEARGYVEGARKKLGDSLINLNREEMHSIIETENLTSGLDKLVEDFLAELDEKEKKQQGLTDPDLLKHQIEDLFLGKVGDPPASQDELDELMVEARRRIDADIPPGYLNRDKKLLFSHRSLNYEGKYGDYIVWRQLLNYACKVEHKNLVFVTAEKGEDWWQIMSLDGPKTIGPRRELYEDFLQVKNMSRFLMYRPDRFLNFSKQILGASVSDETLTEVRRISTDSTVVASTVGELREDYIQRKQAALQWIGRLFADVAPNPGRLPQYISYERGSKVGFDILSFGNAPIDRPHLRDSLLSCRKRVASSDFSEITIVWIVRDEADLKEAIELISHTRFFGEKSFRGKGDNVRLIIGLIDRDALGSMRFVMRYSVGGNIINNRFYQVAI